MSSARLVFERPHIEVAIDNRRNHACDIIPDGMRDDHCEFDAFALEDAIYEGQTQKPMPMNDSPHFSRVLFSRDNLQIAGQTQTNVNFVPVIVNYFSST